MERVVIHSAGGFDKLKTESFAIESLKEDEVLVKTHSIGVNFADCLVRMGYYSSAKKYVGWPITPGFEFSGIVEAVGKNIRDIQIGREVFGISRFSAYATHTAVPRNQIFPIPESLTLDEAGGFPIIYLTAYYALHMSAHIFPGSKILVHSAAGGVGSALIQLCKLANWSTIGVVGSPRKADYAIEMGADIVIDKSSENLWAAVEKHAPEGLDVVLDGNGAETLKEGYEHLRETGKMISYGFHSMFTRGRGKANPLKLITDYIKTPKFNPITIRNKSLVSFNLSFLFDRTDLLQSSITPLISWISSGEIKMPKINKYRFKDVSDAHKDLQSGKTIGKLVLIND